MVDMRLRSEVNGSSATRSNRCAPLGDAQLSLRDQKGSLGRVALDLPVTVSLPQIGVAGQAPAAEHHDVLC
jgi:hypothetical protein